jgi:hypothetical protein
VRPKRALEKLADESGSRLLHEKLDHCARLFCAPTETLGVPYQWSARHGRVIL